MSETNSENLKTKQSQPDSAEPSPSTAASLSEIKSKIDSPCKLEEVELPATPC